MKLRKYFLMVAYEYICYYDTLGKRYPTFRDYWNLCFYLYKKNPKKQYNFALKCMNEHLLKRRKIK